MCTTSCVDYLPQQAEGGPNLRTACTHAACPPWQRMRLQPSRPPERQPPSPPPERPLRPRRRMRRTVLPRGRCGGPAHSGGPRSAAAYTATAVPRSLARGKRRGPSTSYRTCRERAVGRGERHLHGSGRGAGGVAQQSDCELQLQHCARHPSLGKCGARQGAAPTPVRDQSDPPRVSHGWGKQHDA